MSTTDGAPREFKHLSGIVQALPTTVLLADARGHVIYVNERGPQVTGRKAEEFLGLGWLSIVHPDDQPKVAQAWRDAVATGEPFEAEFRIACSDQTFIWALTRAVPVRQDGKVDHWLATCTEISDQKCAEELLSRQERWFRSTFEDAAVGVAHVRADGRFLAVNDRLCDLLQRSRSELLATSFQKITYPADLPQDEDNLARMLRGEIDHYTQEKRYVRPDGSTFWSCLRVGLKRDQEGQPEHLVALVEDITAHKARYDRLEQTLASLGCISWEWDPSTDQLVFTGDPRSVLGFLPSTATEFVAAIHVDDQPVVLKRVEALASQQDSATQSFRLITPEGTQRWLDSEARAIKVGGQRLVAGLIKDITDEKAARDRFVEQEERLRLAFKASATSAWDWDVQSNKVVWAGELAQRLGLGTEGFAGTFDAFWALVVDEDKPTLTDALAAALAGERDYEVEFRMRRRDGAIRWTTTKAIVLRDMAGKPMRMVGVDADITDRKLVEEALREQSAFLSSVLASTTDRIKVIDLDGTLTYMNSNGLKSFGITDLSTLVGQRWASLWPEDQWPLIDDAVSRGAQGLHSRFHAQDEAEDGSARWWDVSVTPCQDEDGNTLRMVAIARDVSATKRHERQVQALADRAELAQFAAGAFVYEYSPGEETVYRSPSTFSVLGYLPEEIVPTRNGWLTLVHPSDRQRFEMEFDEAAREASSYAVSYRALRKTGEVIHVTDVGRIFRRSDGSLERFVGSVTDVTAWSKAEKALADSEAQFRAITEAMPQMVWSADPSGSHDYFNTRWYEFTGVPAGSTHGQGWRGIFHPDDWPRIDKQWGRSLATGAPYEIEYRLRASDGAYRWVLGRALPVRGESGEIVKWMGTCTDIDDVVKSRQALSEAVQAKDALLREVNHRVKNSFQLVSAIIMLQARGVSDPSALAVLRTANQRINTLARLHSDLYQDDAQGEIEVYAHLTKLFTETIDAYAGGRIEAHVDAHGQLQLDLDVAIPLSMIVAELVTNSIKYAFPDNGRGWISLGIEHHHDKLVVDVFDNGVGLPDGFTLSSTGGLGTRIISALTKQIHAELVVHSVRSGASFQIIIPVTEML